ncbi:MAG: 4Fe-4S dicluster domain-containing protein [Sarcina sp.]
MAILNFFKSEEIFKEKFKLKGKNPIEIGELESLERKEVILEKDSIRDIIKSFKLYNDSYVNFEGNKILIKAFSYEGNLDIYDFLSTKEEEIKKAIEALKLINDSFEIKLAGRKSFASLGAKIPSKDIISCDREKFVAEYFGNSDSSKVLILELIDLVYLGEALLNNKGNDFIYTSVFGSAVNEGEIIKVKIGTPLKEIFNLLNGKEELLSKIVSGGVITGTVKSSLDDLIMGNECGLLFLTKEDEKRKKESPCIRCAKCLRVCPKGLNPIKITETFRLSEKEEFFKFGGDKCINCGLCSYNCPSNIELSHKIYTAQLNLIEKVNKEVRSEQLV